MKQRLLFVLASAIICLGAMAADWVHPVPAHVDIVYGDTVYLYNVEAQSFFLGANYYNTRASVSPSKGYKCVLEQTDNGITIKDSVETKQGMYYLWATAADNIWVDYASEGNIYWNFVANSDGSYNIYNTLPDLATYPLGTDLSTDNATILYLNESDVDDETAKKLQNSWYIVTMAAYDEYFVAYEIYTKAQNLKALIDEAAGFGLETGEAETVYANTSSSLEALQTAYDSLLAAINDYKENAATPDNPQDLTATYIPDADFEANQGSGVWQRTHSAQNFQTGGTPGKMGDDTYFLEAWHGSAFTGKTYVSITGLPNGVYQFTLSAATNGGDGCYVYAGTDSVEVTTGSTMTPYTVFTRVEDGNLEVGLNCPTAIQNWIGIDDAKLLYLGNSVASYAYWVKTNMKNAPEYNDDTFAQTSLIESYNALIQTDPSSFATVNEVLAYNDQFNAALAEVKENVAAYAAYQALINEGEELMNAGYEGEEVNVLSDYIMEDYEKISSEKALSTEEMIAETEKLAAMIEDVKINCLAPGMDCTNLITNPNFDNRMNGWSHDENYADGAWGGLSSNPCVERWNDNFDFYQILTNVPNGVYEMKVQAFYRPTGSTTSSYTNYIADPNTDEILTYIYANKSQAPICNIAAHTYSENLEGDCEEVATGVYVPNGMSSASNAFSQGHYENSVVGVVTDGTLKIGIKSTEGTVSARWSLWDNFRLAYIGYDEDALKALFEETIAQAQELEEADAIGAAELSALETALEADPETGEEIFDAIVALQNAISNAEESITAYEKLDAAIIELDNAMTEYESTASETAINNAAALSEEAGNAYDDGSYSVEEIDAKIDEITKAIAALKLPTDTENASDDNPVNMTVMIVNPSFETGDMTGWTRSSAASGDTGVKENSNSTYTVSNADGDYVFNTWNGSLVDFYVQQDIVGLPAGTYKLEALLASDLGNVITLSAGDSSVDITTTSEKDTAIEASLYFNVAEGETVTIKAASGTWFKADNFRLTYYGTESANSIVEVENNIASDPVAIYSVSGARIYSLQKGINIVKHKSGEVKKVYIK